MLLANEFFLVHPTLGHGFDFRHLKVDGEFETSLILTVLGFFQLHAGAVKDIGPARQVLETNLSDVRRIESSELGKRKTSIRSEEHTSELQSLMRISYAVFCLKKKKKQNQNITI